MPSFARPQANTDEDFTQLWERHIAAARKQFGSTRDDDTAPAGDVGHVWDEKMDSVVDALELAVQSPHSRAPSSPEPLWSVRDDYSETALSSPTQGSIFSTAALSKPSPKPNPMPTPIITISSHDDDRDTFDPDTPMVEIGGRHSKGKELASYYLDRSRLKKHRDSHHHSTPSPSPSPSFPDPKHLLYKNYSNRYVPDSPLSAVETPITSFRSALHIQNPPPSEVHALILTWAKHDRRGDDGQLLSPGLDIETDTVRACFKRRGYRVQCRVIPEDYPTSAVETILDKFLAKSKPGNLLVVYYRGEGGVEGDRMVFSSGFGGSSFHWDDVRDPIMQAPGDLLMVLDCSAAPGIEHPEIRMEAGLIPSPSTKQLLGVCAPYSYSGMAGADNFMTKSLCRALDGDVAGLEEGEGRGLGESGDGMGTRMVSVQGLCGAMKGYLRREGIEGSTVFVTQLGGGQLMDIYLPRL